MISEFTRQHLTNTSWAVALLTVGNMPLLTAIAASALRLCSACTAPDLARTSWAFAALELRHAPLSDAISASSRRTSFASFALMNSAWALAVLVVLHAPLLASIAAQALRTSSDWQMEDILPHSVGVGSTLGTTRDLVAGACRFFA